MSLSPLVWLAVGIALMGAEIVAPGFVIFWFGVGGLLVALLTWLGITGTALLQWGSFFLSSLAFLLLWQFVFRRFFPGRTADKTRDPTLSGLEGRVTGRIAPPAAGEVELFAPFHGIRRWQAEAGSVLEEGAPIRVVEARGVRVFVAPVERKPD